MKRTEASIFPVRHDHSDPDGDLAGALHEVSNSLTVVMGWLDRAVQDPAAVQRALRVARAHAWQGYRVARRAIGAEVAEEAPHDVAEVVSRALEAVRCEADRKSVRLELQGSRDGGPPVLEASTAAQQILLNLLLNAIAFTPSGRVVRTAWSVEAGCVALSVQDEGPGIEPERAASILSGPPSTRPGGAGIGLTHSVNLAKANGGELRLMQTGPGARFELHWPIGEARSGARHSDVAPPMADQSKVLVLEDDPHITELLELSLSARGAEVRVVASLEELCALSRDERTADVALVDLSPLSDDLSAGLELVQAMVLHAPIVLITGRATPLPEGSEELVAAWVRKPFDMDELSHVLQDVVSRQ